MREHAHRACKRSEAFFDLLPDFLKTQVPVFAMSWEVVWCTEIHGTLPKVVPACTGGTWVTVPYMAYFGFTISTLAHGIHHGIHSVLRFIVK